MHAPAGPAAHANENSEGGQRERAPPLIGIKKARHPTHQEMSHGVKSLSIYTNFLRCAVYVTVLHA